MASVNKKTPLKEKLPNKVFRPTPKHMTMGMRLQKRRPIALMSAVIIFLPGGLEKMNILTTQPLKKLNMVQTMQNVTIIVLSISGQIVLGFRKKRITKGISFVSKYASAERLIC